MSFDNENINNKIPVSIITGYLGSGKTTFINYLLKQNHGYKFAIIENEFGEVGIDNDLVLKTDEEIIEMMNGCICCTVREDLIVTIKKLISTQKDKFNHILIETTGLADPAPVAQTFFIDEEISKLCKLDAIITFIDCKYTLQHLNEQKPEGVENEAHEQVAFADVLILNKTDLIGENELSDLKVKLKNVNVHAKMIESQYSKIPIDQVINIQSFDLEKTLSMDDSFLDISSEHQHDSSISSFGIHIEGEFNFEQFIEWLQNLISNKGQDIYRCKGILSMIEMEEKFIFQGVHMLLDFGSSSEFGNKDSWKPDEKRINKFCFIGKNLNKDEITEGLKGCIFNGQKPDPGPIPTKQLRFKVGDRVECKTDDWEKGIITQLWYREDYWETGRYVPYQVLMDNGDLIWVPRDINKFIKKFDLDYEIKIENPMSNLSVNN